VAPGSASSYGKDVYDEVVVPTMIVVGERDGKGSSNRLANIKTSTRKERQKYITLNCHLAVHNFIPLTNFDTEPSHFLNF
jgi:hypothetical protein